MELIVNPLGKQYRGNVWRLKDFSLKVAPGILGLLGPIGAGKSTLTNILATITVDTFSKVRQLIDCLSLNSTKNGEEDESKALYNALTWSGQYFRIAGYCYNVFTIFRSLGVLVVTRREP